MKFQDDAFTIDEQLALDLRLKRVPDDAVAKVLGVSVHDVITLRQKIVIKINRKMARKRKLSR